MSKILLALLLVAAIIAVPVSAITLCPWGDPETFVPTTPITVDNVYSGSCIGFSTITQQVISQRKDNGTQLVGSNFNYMGSTGTHEVAMQSTVYNGELGVSVYDIQDVRYSGIAASLGTSQFGMEVDTGDGNDTPVNCLITQAGTDLVMYNGQYSGVGDTSVLGKLQQQYAMVGTGEGIITTYSSSSSRTGLQIGNSNKKVPLVGYESQRFSATMMGKYDVQYAYNYHAGI
jgi:hypothetical protein